jgi:glycosyltransferase involved in cell wall biosynthesis
MTDRVVTGRFLAQPRVDIILPTRNQAEQTWDSVQSVLAQSYEKWRLIVVDDASDPFELRKLENLLPSHSRIQFVRRSTPGGAHAARATGLSHSRSQLVAFLDSGDLWLADKLQRQVSLLLANAQSSSKTVVLSGHIAITAAGTTRIVDVPSRENYLTCDNVSCLLTTAKALEAAGGARRADDVPLKTGEEIDLFIRLFQIADVLIVPECLTLCRDRVGEPDNGQPRSVGAHAYAELIRRHADFLSASAPSLYQRLLVRAGGRFFDAEQYGAAARHFFRAVRIGSAHQRLEVLRVIAWLAARRLSATHAVARDRRTAW